LWVGALKGFGEKLLIIRIVIGKQEDRLHICKVQIQAKGARLCGK
jgi:hypothetical protein